MEKNIKNIKGILTIGLFGLAIWMSSCEKWLDVQPQTRIERDELFENEIGYRDALIGVYAGLASNSLYGREMTFATLDVLAGYYSPVNVGNNTYYQFYTNYPYKRNDASKIASCGDIVDRMWSGMYFQVAKLNSILETIDANKNVFSDDNYEIVKGEALGLRAFIHFDLLRMYGKAYSVGANEPAIPYVDTLSTLITRLSTVEQAANRIITDLEQALPLLDRDPMHLGIAPSTVLASAVGSPKLSAYHNRRYHFNYYAAKALLGRAYLWKGDKEKALLYAKELIAEQATRFPWVLEDNITSILVAGRDNKDRTFTTEHIFAINKPSLEELIPNYYTSEAVSVTNLGNLLATSKQVFEAIYGESNLDPRSDKLMEKYNDNLYVSTKLLQESSNGTWFRNQIPLIRIAEMYYIAAECEPNYLDGLTWLNIIRQKRAMLPLSTAQVNSAERLQEEIQKEYHRQFIGEGQLWFYYKRLNKSSLPYSSGFDNTDLYVFDMPEDEYANGGR